MLMIIDEVACIAVLVSVNVKDPNQQKHREQTAQRPAHSRIDGKLLTDGMGQEVQQRDAEHQPADKAHQDLHPAMRELDEIR